MPTAKAQYNAPPTLAEMMQSEEPVSLKDLSKSEKLRLFLRDFYPHQSAQADEFFGHPADEFVNYLLSQAYKAIPHLDTAKRALVKQDIKAELQDLLDTLTEAQQKLRKLSTDVDRLLGVEADPLGCADKLGELIPYVLQGQQAVAQLPRRPRYDQMQHAIAVELAIDVLRAARHYGIRASATFDNIYHEYASPAVQILKAIGDDIGLVLDEYTWRDIILEAKEKYPALK
ncbi:hypothetical protein [Chitinimonas lacunae]|uniref:Uncharacterized protein n=1 Tax=Chitinimonas lacunae TaxID=1963018 RepID=A0ABV8MRV5_9NEIS